MAARFGGVATACALFAVVAQQAQAHAGPVMAAITESLAKTAETVKQPKRTQYELVFNGVDLDGDGAADFTNPTGKAVRHHDVFGYGEFGASRDGGERSHEGVDYTGLAGQQVVSPISGQVTKMGYAYGNDASLKYVEITNAALNIQARVFYVAPDVAIGDVVALGQPVGKLVSLQARYPGITDHTHLELYQSGERVDASTKIVARTVVKTEG